MAPAALVVPRPTAPEGPVAVAQAVAVAPAEVRAAQHPAAAARTWPGDVVFWGKHGKHWRPSDDMATHMINTSPLS